MLLARSAPLCLLLAILAPAPAAAMAAPPKHHATTPHARALLDSLKPGHWLAIPHSEMQQVIYRGPLAQEVRGVSGPRAIIAAWGGAAFDTKRQRLVLTGGGHHGYAGNEVYAFDMNRLQWERLTDPSPIKGYDGSGIYPDGTPASRHTYNDLAYIPDPIDRLFDQGGARYSIGYGTPYTWLFDFTRRKWDRKADSPVSGYGDITAYDPVTGHVWMEAAGTHGYLLDYDPRANRWTAHGSEFSNSINIYTTGALDPERRLFVAVGGKAIYAWYLSDSPTIAYTMPQTSGDKAVEAAGSPGFVYYPPGREFVGWIGGSTVYTLDPANWKWTAHSAAPDNRVVPTPPNRTGTFGRFRYVAAKNVFVLVNSVDQNVYLYRPNFGARNAPAKRK